MLLTFIARPVLRFLLSALFMLFFAIPAFAAQQETILIVDGSGSMWGKFDKEHKIVTVRDILPKQLKPYEGKGHLGIMSYGHRWKSNCRDIELITPISKIAASTHGKKLSRLSARGKTPITGALKLAYSKFSKDAKIKQIILLSDGTENCRADPCQFMKELVAKDKNIVAHVITYGMGKKDAKKLQCISKLSQGEFFRPLNKKELDVTVAGLFAKTLERQWKPIVKRVPLKKVVPGLFLKAYLGKSNLQLKDNVKWLIYKNKKDADKVIAPLFTSEKGAPVFNLENGSYYIQLIREQMGSGQTITFKKDSHKDVIFRLNAGIISFNLDAKQDFLKAVHDFRIALIPQKKGNRSIPVVSTQNSKQAFTLAAGQYKLVMSLKNSLYEQKILLRAGEQKTIKIPLKVGLLSLEALQSFEGQHVHNISYKIMRKNQNGAGDFSEYARLASQSPKLVLPVGMYYVAAKSDLAVAIENFTITAGQETHIPLNLNAGSLTLTSKLSNSKELQNGEVTYTISQSDLSAMESQSALLKTSRTNQQINLPAGNYIISSSVGNGGSYTEQNLEIQAGQHQTVSFEHKAGVVQLACQKSGGKRVRRNVFWQVFNENGQPVARSSLASLKLLLEQGKYTAQAFYEGKKYLTQFQVSASSSQSRPETILLKVQ